MRAIGSERFRFEEKEHAVIGESTGGVFRLGQAVKVKLAEAAPLTGGLRFDMLSDPLPCSSKRKGKAGKPSQPGRGKKAKSKRREPSKGRRDKATKKKRGKANAKPRRG